MPIFKEKSPGRLVSFGNWLADTFFGLFFFVAGLFFFLIIYNFWKPANKNEEAMKLLPYILPVIAMTVGASYIILRRKVIIDTQKQTVIVCNCLLWFPYRKKSTSLPSCHAINIYQTNGGGSGCTAVFRVDLGKIEFYRSQNKSSAQKQAEFLAQYLNLPIKFQRIE